MPTLALEELGWNGTGCCWEACSYKPVTRRGAGSPPEAEGRREQPDEDGNGLRIREELVCLIPWNFLELFKRSLNTLNRSFVRR